MTNNENLFKTPILFIIFNRPDTTSIVFSAIKKIKPKYLFVAADGPRDNREGEKEKCLTTRDIIKEIDWDCELKTLFREKNLGCKIAVSGAITWFFENVGEGIILEDDCLPNISFFNFCEELLTKYRDDERIMQIGGVNFQDGKLRSDGTYYFSKKNHIWGWATWKRAWDMYDINMSNFPKFKEQNQILNITNNKKLQKKLLDKIQYVYDGKLDTWDYQWEYTILSNNGLVILPNYNLVSNIGFNQDATHTTGHDELLANKPTDEINIITHPSFVINNTEADEYLFNKEIRENRIDRKIIRKIKKIFKLK